MTNESKINPVKKDEVLDPIVLSQSFPETGFSNGGKVRTRFAPSPTGFLHIGGARTAFFNYLFAKSKKGSFILRIEDTDIERSKKEYEKDIIDSLKWLGIEWDEGPDIGGLFGPYRQSEKKEVYAKYLERLLKEGKAYYCFCSEEELEVQKQYQLSRGEAPHYNGNCANLMPEEIKKRLSEGKSCVIRFKVSAEKVEFEDLIRGHIEFDTSLIGDMVIAKDLMTPLYNFTVVIDDYEMQISHVIRGEEHISNTPKQILIQKALEIPQPKYTHIPMILAPDRSKLSKRHGATGVLEFKKDGYLPEAVVNFIAFLGWNPGGDREIYSLPSLIKEFSMERVQKGGAIFNIKRLDFLNGFYIRQRSIEKLTELCIPYLVENGLIIPLWEQKELISGIVKGMTEVTDYQIVETKEKISFENLKKIVLLYQERLKKLSEISELINFFFRDKLNYDKDLLKWKGMPDKEVKDSLNKLEKILSKIKKDDFNKENLEKILILEAEEKGDRGYLLWPLRVALTGKEASAGPFEIADILGREKTLKRIKEAKEKYK